SSSYDKLAGLYRDHADKARRVEVKEDYRQLAVLYEVKAAAATERARTVGISSVAESQAELVEEGNLFVKRLLGALSTGGPVGDAERRVVLGRLGRHGERCIMLTEQLSEEIRKVFGGPEGGEKGQRRADGTKVGTTPVLSKESSAKEAAQIAPGQ